MHLELVADLACRVLYALPVGAEVEAPEGGDGMAENVRVMVAKLERLLQLNPEAFARLERLLDEVLAESEADWAATVAVAR